MRSPAFGADAAALLQAPAPNAARAIARARLARGLEKAAPLMVVVDDDALRLLAGEEVHALRVALRRLRSWLRACRPLLRDDVPRPLLVALRKLARRAGGARDAQVQWKWLATDSAPRTAAASRAALWYAEVRAADFAHEYARLQRAVRARWPALAATLGDALHDREVEAIDSAPTLAAHLGAVIAHHATAARDALDQVEHVAQVKAIHRARIAIKRLRYVLDAAHASSRGARAALTRLRRLQDALGEMHDAHIMTEFIGAALAAPRRRGASRPPLRELRALRAALRRRELAAFRASMDLLATRGTTAMWTAVAAVAGELSPGIPGTRGGA